MRGILPASLFIVPGALVVPAAAATTSYRHSAAGGQILLGSSRSSSYLTEPIRDTISCPLSDAIIPIYGPPSQHHSYITAVTTFCRRDLPHIQHGSPHTTSSTPPSDLSRSSSSSSSSSSFQNKDYGHDEANTPPLSTSPSSPPIIVSLPPSSTLARSYRITLVTSAGEVEHVDWVWHQLQLEIENHDDKSSVIVTEDDCVASFMKIVEAAGGCRVSDMLTKLGEYHVGRGDASVARRGLAGVVFRAEQWK